jgi:transposase InsO family protein
VEYVNDDIASKTLVHARIQGADGRPGANERQPIAEVWRDLDLTETAVRRWVAQAEIDAGRRDGLTTAKSAVFELIAGWYNQYRRHSTLGYLSPADVERRTPPVTLAA